MAEELGQYLRGWMGYFGRCRTSSVLEGLEKWTSRGLRLWSGISGSGARYDSLNCGDGGK